MGIITPEHMLKSKYDVIVIGAGLGGLTTASLLAKRGLDGHVQFGLSGKPIETN